MKEMLKIDLSEINPHIRLVQYLNTSSADYYVPWRIIYDFEMIFIVKGEFRISTANKTQDLSAGDFIIIPPFLLHKQEILEGHECCYYAAHLDFYYEKNQEDFSWEDVYSRPCNEHYETGIELEELNNRQIYEPEGLDLSVLIHIKDFETVFKLFENMFTCFRKNTDISGIELRAYAILLIAVVLREIDSQTDESDYAEHVVKRFSDYISRHFSEQIDLAEFSREYGFTPNYFRRIFKQITYFAPHDYLINKRMEEAKKLLRLGRYTVQTVSLMVGYDDVHYFTRLFKKREGISPAQYSEQHRLKE